MYIFVPLLCIFFMLSPTSEGRVNDLNARIVEAAQEVLLSRYASSAQSLEVRIVRTGGEINNSGPLKLIWPQKTEIPRALLRVEIQSNDIQANMHKGWALLYIAHFDSVMVLNRSVKNNEMLQESDVTTIWTETTRFHGTPLTPEHYRKLNERGPIYANRYVAEKRMLKSNDLRNSYDVETGQQVIMIYERSGIALELTCKSRNQGFEGDIVKLFSPDTKHMYKAQITGPQKAVWVETLE